jgi:hypothetical protein
LELEQAAPMDFMSFPGLNFDISTPSLYPTPESNPRGEAFVDSGNLLAAFQLPSHDLLVELVELFFENLSHMFPCFHRKNFQRRVELGKIQEQSSLILYAMCCLAARFHPDASTRQHEKDWYEQAKFSYQLTQRDPYPGLLTIQAAVLIIAYASTAGDFSSGWLFLGKAWRQAIALGMNRMDANTAADIGMRLQDMEESYVPAYIVEKENGTSAIEKEEQRRTLWLLFIMDRNLAWPTGWPNALPETHFKIDFPIADSLLQAMNPEAESKPGDNTPFTRNLGRLITSASSARDPINVFHYVCIAHVLLGRAAELIHSLHDAPDTIEYAEECDELDSHIVKFRMSIPRRATSVLEADSADREHVVWLQLMLNIGTMLVNYRSARSVSIVDASYASSRFTIAVAAARSTAKIVKDASRISIDLLLSPHIASSLYVAALLLVIQWRTTGDPSYKEEVDLFSLLFERMNEVFVFLGLKFQYALEHDLEKSRERLEDLRDRGFRGLLADCTKWTHVKERVIRNGLPIDIT